MIGRIRAKTGQHARRSLILQNSPGHSHRRPAKQRTVSIHSAIAGLPPAVGVGAKVLDRLSKLPQIADVSSDQQNLGLSSNVDIDRDTASRLGLTAQAVDCALYDAFGQRQVSTMYKSINQYHVVLALEQQWWESPDFLNTIYLQTPRGVDSAVHVHAFHPGDHAAFDAAPGPVPGQSTISFNLVEGYSLEDAVQAINKAEIDIGMPTSYHRQIRRYRAGFQASLKDQPMLILTALVAVYIVLGILYESLIHPLTIISTLPSAGVGALIALVLFRTELTIIAMIGIILLIGIVKKNAIMMIDFALAAARKKA